MKFATVKLSPYERAINRLNDLPRNLDKIFSEALEDLRRQRDEAIAELTFIKEEYEKANASDLTRDALVLQNVALGLENKKLRDELEKMRGKV